MDQPPQQAPEKLDPKPYLDYIDKEMNFCGIITTFSLASVLFMFDKLLSKPEDAGNINFKSSYFILALGSLIVSAFFLFRQRSVLAHHYGQISLEVTQPGFTGKSLTTWLREVDDWSFWNLYIYGISLIKCAFVQIFILLIITFYKACLIAQYFPRFSILISGAIIVAGLLITLFGNIKLARDTSTP
jgi:hypothetical protein